jgi:hypothetical protein
MVYFRHHPEFVLEGQRRTTIDLSQDSRFADRDFNLRPPEYESGRSGVQ